ncbi:MAG: glycogen/starch/alpha-glucan family phosphorylase [Clostridia bacterium]|nr:glycogen/starch/alpha-glucan family phosphorylase [Clostridia bacterium]
MTAKELIKQAEALLLMNDHVTLEEASATQLHNAISGAAMQSLAPVWVESEKKREGQRQAYYLSSEYLMGRMVYNNLYCLGYLDEVKALLAERGVDITVMEDIEDDAFGNGGLGRLAACFLDSAVTTDVPLTGYGLRYKYGLFKQSFEDGRQVEAPDDWAKFGDPWSIRRLDKAVVVKMKTGDVHAVPYDMPIIGYGANNIGTLRLWQTEPIKAVDFFQFNEQHYEQAAADRNRAEDIVKFLYPNDSRREGKQMRIKQQYVLVSASLQDMVRSYKERHGDDYAWFAAEHAVQLNDTHPVMAIPELIRLLMEDDFTFEAAFQIARDTFAYTNHTVMQEALEKWDVDLMNSVCPEIVEIIRMIDKKFKAEMAAAGHEVKYTRCIIWDNQIHMAQLAVYASYATNGVAAIHSEILKNDVFADWYELYPERFQNKTNGITQRRWLGLCNPELVKLICGRIGNGFLTDLYQLENLKPLIDDDLARDFIAVKHEKKVQLAREIELREGVKLDPNMIFDIQVKRLHEYKRQFMNALSILNIYYKLKDGSLTDFTPTAFIFGAKAAAGYARAKAVIHLINMIADIVNNDPETNHLLKVVFVQNYNCSWAEKIIPAADVSEQISPAGTEASGTGNMKLMLNGAVTLGTFDGANVEIVEQAGRENNYIFGATVDEINALKPVYDPRAIYKADADIARVLDALVNGTFPDEDGALKELVSSLLVGASWHQPDHYFLLHDFNSYMEAKLRCNRDYRDSIAFAKKCLYNVASAGKFSSDRTIRQYADEIWHV